MPVKIFTHKERRSCMEGVVRGIKSDKSLREICKAPRMPSEETIYVWMRRWPEFAEEVRQARLIQAHRVHDKMIEAEDAVLNGALDPAAAAVALRSAQWRAARLAPRDYGDKVQERDDRAHIALSAEARAVKIKQLMEQAETRKLLDMSPADVQRLGVDYDDTDDEPIDNDEGVIRG